jgi:FixJ family two-component response regulator
MEADMNVGSEATVFIVDDDLAVRDLLRTVLRAAGIGVEVFSSAPEFLDAYQPDRPGCLLLDVRMPGMTGLELQSELARRNIEIPVVFLSGYGDVPVAVEAMQKGAFDFVEKTTNHQELVQRIRKAIEWDQQQREDRGRTSAIAERYEQLTNREREVLELMVTSKSNKLIAAELGISLRTVEGHRARIMRKMQAVNVVDLVRMAIAIREPDKPSSTARID